MKRELRDKWVAAMRSGKYKQAREHLWEPDGAKCPLGVLAYICGAAWTGEGCSAAERGRELLSEDFLRSAGLTDLQQKGIAARVTRGESFAETADWVEANL